MKRFPILAALCAPLALGGCSSMWAGTAIGGAGGFDGPGAAGVKTEGCDVSAQGSIALVGVEFYCQTKPDGTMTKRAKIQSVDPGAALAAALKSQADIAAKNAELFEQLAPLAAQAAATAAAGPAAGAAAAALLKPPAKPPAVTVDTTAIPPTP